MKRAWLKIPLQEYEGHMSAANVRQLDALSALFAIALRTFRPLSVAVLGVAGGNGLEQIDSTVTKRVIGLDIQPEYLRAVRTRHAQLPGLELCCADLCEDNVLLDAFANAPVQLVHAALLFEHTGLAAALDNALAVVAPHGVFSVVLQLRSAEASDVTATEFPSMQTLRDEFALIDVQEFCRKLELKDFRLIGEHQHSLPGGKALWMGFFRPGGN
jgi:methyltransferase family protein